MWFKVSSAFTGVEWTHDVSVYMTRFINPEEENACWCEFSPSIDCSMVYFVFVFSEDTISDYNVYTERYEACDAFDDLVEGQSIFNDREFQIIEKSYNGDACASIYAKNTRGQYIWMDTSTRIVMRGINIDFVDNLPDSFS